MYAIRESRDSTVLTVLTVRKAEKQALSSDGSDGWRTVSDGWRTQNASTELIVQQRFGRLRTVRTVVSVLYLAGVLHADRTAAEGERLVIRGPKSAGALAKQLLASKAELMAVLRSDSAPTIVDPPPGITTANRTKLYTIKTRARGTA